MAKNKIILRDFYYDSGVYLAGFISDVPTATIVGGYDETEGRVLIKPDGDCLFNSMLFLLHTEYSHILAEVIPSVTDGQYNQQHLRTLLAQKLEAIKNGTAPTFDRDHILVAIKTEIEEDVINTTEYAYRIHHYAEPLRSQFEEIIRLNPVPNTEERRLAIRADLERLLENEDIIFDEYIKKISTPGAFGGEVELQILAVALKLEITQIDRAGTAPQIYSNTLEQRGAIKVIYNYSPTQQGDHYDALVSETKKEMINTFIVAREAEAASMVAQATVTPLEESLDSVRKKSQIIKALTVLGEELEMKKSSETTHGTKKELSADVTEDEARITEERVNKWFFEFIKRTNEKELTKYAISQIIRYLIKSIREEGKSDLLNSKAKHVVVDIGCGEGTFTAGMLEAFIEEELRIKIHGIDADQKSVYKAISKIDSIRRTKDSDKEEESFSQMVERGVYTAEGGRLVSAIGMSGDKIICGNCFDDDFDQLPQNPLLMIVSHVAYYSGDIKSFVNKILRKAGPDTIIIFAHQSHLSEVNKMRVEFDSPLKTDVVSRLEEAINSFRESSDISAPAHNLDILSMMLGSYINIPFPIDKVKEVLVRNYKDLDEDESALSVRHLLEFFIHRPMEALSAEDRLEEYVERVKDILIDQQTLLLWDRIQIVLSNTSIYYSHLKCALREFIKFKNEIGFSPIHLAVLEGNVAVVSDLIGEFDTDILKLTALNYITPLYLAIFRAQQTSNNYVYIQLIKCIYHAVKEIGYSELNLITYADNPAIKYMFRDHEVVKRGEHVVFPHPLVGTFGGVNLSQNREALSPQEITTIVKKIEWILDTGHFLLTDSYFVLCLRQFVRDFGLGAINAKLQPFDSNEKSASHSSNTLLVAQSITLTESDRIGTGEDSVRLKVGEISTLEARAKIVIKSTTGMQLQGVTIERSPEGGLVFRGGPRGGTIGRSASKSHLASGASGATKSQPKIQAVGGIMKQLFPILEIDQEDAKLDPRVWDFEMGNGSITHNDDTVSMKLILEHESGPVPIQEQTKDKATEVPQLNFDRLYELSNLYHHAGKLHVAIRISYINIIQIRDIDTAAELITMACKQLHNQLYEWVASCNVPEMNEDIADKFIDHIKGYALSYPSDIMNPKFFEDLYDSNARISVRLAILYLSFAVFLANNELECFREFNGDNLIAINSPLGYTFCNTPVELTETKKIFSMLCYLGNSYHFLANYCYGSRNLDSCFKSIGRAIEYYDKACDVIEENKELECSSFRTQFGNLLLKGGYKDRAIVQLHKAMECSKFGTLSYLNYEKSMVDPILAKEIELSGKIKVKPKVYAYYLLFQIMSFEKIPVDDILKNFRDFVEENIEKMQCFEFEMLAECYSKVAGYESLCSLYMSLCTAKKIVNPIYGASWAWRNKLKPGLGIEGGYFLEKEGESGTETITSLHDLFLAKANAGKSRTFDPMQSSSPETSALADVSGAASGTVSAASSSTPASSAARASLEMDSHVKKLEISRRALTEDEEFSLALALSENKANPSAIVIQRNWRVFILKQRESASKIEASL
jgi:hypothetical protein